MPAGQAVPLPVDVERAGLVEVVVVAERVEGLPGRGVGADLGDDGVVGERRVLDEGVGDVDPEPVDPAVEPVLDDAEEGLPHRRVGPVEVGLLGQEQVAPPLPGRLVEGPGRTPEVAAPVVRWTTVRGRVAPQVEVPVGAVAAAACRAEPLVLVRGVVGHQVDEQAHAAVVHGCDEVVEVVEGAEAGVDTGVVGDVVAEVGHRRGVEGGDPHDVDAEVGEVVEAGGQAREVTDAVTVGVREGPQVDLVAHCVGPPPGIGHLVSHAVSSSATRSKFDVTACRRACQQWSATRPASARRRGPWVTAVPSACSTPASGA